MLSCPWIAENHTLFLLACMTAATLLEAVLLWFAYTRPAPECPVKNDTELALAAICALRDITELVIESSPMRLDAELHEVAKIVKAVNFYRQEKQQDLAS